MKQIILYSHEGSENHGCEAIVRSLSIVLDRLKLSRPILLSEKPESDIKYGIEEIANISNSKQQPNKCSIDFLRALFKLKIKKEYQYLDALPFKKAISSFNTQTIAFSIGGDDYCYADTKVHTLVHNYYVKQGCKTILWACSLSPEIFKDKEIIKGLRKFNLIAVRESLSYKLLKENGFSNIVLFPDLAFLLPSEECDESKLITPNKYIGLNISPLVINSIEDKEIILDNYREIMKYIINNTDDSIALIPHVVWPQNDDRRILKILHNEFKETGRVLLIHDHNCMQLKDIISKCKLFVGARTHATIAAYSSCVPTLVLGYSIKSKGIATDIFGTSEKYVVPVQNIKSATDLLDSFKWLINNEQIIRTHLQCIIPNYISSLKEAEKAILSIYDD